MHVLEVLDYSPPFAGGMIDTMENLKAALGARGHRMTIAFPYAQPLDAEDGWTG